MHPYRDMCVGKHDTRETRIPMTPVLILLPNLLNCMRVSALPSPWSVYIALKAAMVLPALLQKPHMISKSRDHVKCLECCLHLWCEGDINALLVEGQTIQQHLQHSHRTPTTDNSRIFA